jgi:hypothetical protein
MATGNGIQVTLMMATSIEAVGGLAIAGAA